MFFQQIKVMIQNIGHIFTMIDDHKGLYPFYTGLRKVVRSETFMSIEVFSPPIEEQKMISNYLDRKIEQIDKLIQKINKIKIPRATTLNN